MSAQIIELDLSETTIDKLKSFFNKCTNNKSLILNEMTSTQGGLQTKNVLNLIDKSCLIEISENIEKYINQYYANNLEFYQFFIDHVHLIAYTKNGYQIGHTHHSFEDLSFIVYLNNSNAVTRIYSNENYKEIKSVQGKMVIFDASLYHEASVTNNKRNVLVGSVKFLHKIWKKTDQSFYFIR